MFYLLEVKVFENIVRIIEVFNLLFGKKFLNRNLIFLKS